MDCKKCGKCCVNVPMTPAEYRELATRFPAIAAAAIDYGFAVEIHGPCPLLRADNSCAGYEYRARVCRMFPVTVTGHDGTAATMAPSPSCPNAGTVTPQDIDQAKRLNKEFNAEMARSWAEYRATHPDAEQMAVNFLASREPARSGAAGIDAGKTLASVIDRYSSSLGKRKGK
ncbi:MAG: YkgJ family cysteine cluster protein [Candidatus Sigynarchaeota archaeon]